MRNNNNTGVHVRNIVYLEFYNTNDKTGIYANNKLIK